MAPEKPETDGFLTAIEMKIAALSALKDSYLKAVSVGAIGQLGDVDLSCLDQTVKGGAFELPSQALVGKSIPAAVKLYLSSVKKKLTVREIATALKDGGVESTAANFENTVTSALHRLKANDEVLKFKDGWADPSVVPPSMRHRIAGDNDTAARKRARTTKRASTGPKRKAKVNAAPNARVKVRKEARDVSSVESIDARISAYLKAHAGQQFAPKQVGDALNVTNAKVVGMAFARLIRFGKVTKGDDGLYTAARLEAEHLKRQAS